MDSTQQILAEALKLLSAAAIGLLVTVVQRRTRRDQPLPRSMDEAHVLLSVAGALTMMIIGGSVAHAFGIAGAASIIRFRTAVEDPRDVTVLFLMVALGMAAGLGLASVAFAGTVLVCGFLVAAGRVKEDQRRAMKVALVADGPEFPAAHVSRVFAEHHVVIAPLEISAGAQTTVRYRALLDSRASVEELSARLMQGGAVGLKSVSWETSKKRS
jgi:hypothetical protein